ncbi:hypothetical protein [Mesomycoplasma neurolyticum]|uniref:Uncharacterized protein n=1 Tax=Mesomycoplasma neurolyticum TaxID=2120 RepID=A0A449A548_9BACT|nr:hypothetical protein [Mesomycoplasma neurolyticum]VEU59420.1 Uncharacterised protein [Mesomycoplasma neurolyticum]
MIKKLINLKKYFVIQLIYSWIFLIVLNLILYCGYFYYITKKFTLHDAKIDNINLSNISLALLITLAVIIFFIVILKLFFESRIFAKKKNIFIKIIPFIFDFSNVKSILHEHNHFALNKKFKNEVIFSDFFKKWLIYLIIIYISLTINLLFLSFGMKYFLEKKVDFSVHIGAYYLFFPPALWINISFFIIGIYHIVSYIYFLKKLRLV